MPGSHQSGRLLCYPLALTLCFVLVTSCHAVSMDVEVGFDNTAKPGAWTPIAVKLANSGGKHIVGTLLVQEEQDQPWVLPICAARVDLPPKSSKLYHVYAKLYPHNRAVTVMLAVGNRIAVARKVGIQLIASTRDVLVVSIGKRTSRPNFLAGETIQPLQLGGPSTASAQTESTIHVGSITADLLPDRPAGYTGIDALIISDLSPASVSRKTLQAISMWVASGGTLVLSTGPAYQKYLNEFYDELLPVKITGAASIDSFNSLSQIGKSGFPSGSAVVAGSVTKPGMCSRVISESGVPVVAEREYGIGRVVFLALDCQSSPFRDWNGQTEFWKNILSATKSAPLVEASAPNRYLAPARPRYHTYSRYRTPLQNYLADVVEQSPYTRTPSLNSITLFLIAYLVVLSPVNYLILKRIRRLELAWISTPIIVLLFTLGTYAVGYTMKGCQLGMDEAVIVEGSANSRYARVVASASLFSPARRSYKLEISDPFAISQPAHRQERGTPVRVYVGEHSVIENVRMAMWSTRTFESLSGTDLGGPVKANLVLNGSRIQGRIHNATNIQLKDCRVIYGASKVRVGDLASGASAVIDIEYKPPGSELSNTQVLSTMALDRRLRWFTERKASASGVPVLVGRPAAETSIFRLGGARAATQSAARCTFRLNYKFRPGSVFNLHPGMIQATVIDLNNARPPESSELSRHFDPEGLVMQVWSRGYFIASYRLPAPPGSKINFLRVHGWQRARGREKLDTFIHNNVVRRWDPVDVTTTKPIPSPWRYIDSQNRVKLKAELTQGNHVTVGIGISAEGRLK